MDYQSALQYLYGLTDFAKERIARYDPDTLDLLRTKRVLARLGDPHQQFAAVHIAGTKGKGSVAVTCASILQAAGLRTGLYTSPHLHTFRERIRVDGESIPPGALVALLQRCRPVFDAEPELTTFEAITALAFTYFAQRRIDFAVVEVGLGGRLDATNVITPLVTVITSLSLDHTYLLGNTLPEIAYEKAGIIKPRVPTVCAPQKDEALDVIQQVCDERGSPLTLIGRDWKWQLPASSTGPSEMNELFPSLDGQSFDLHFTPGVSPLEGTHTTPLLGRHQLSNTAAAIAAIDLLRRAGVSIHPRHVRQGLAAVRWAGRFEVLERHLPLVADCAHNADSAAKLVAALGEWFPGRRWTFILGVSVDKDLPGMLRALAPLADRVLTTRSRHPRAMSASKVAQIASQVLPEAGAPLAEVEVTSDVGSALDLALNADDPWHGLTSPPQVPEWSGVHGRGDAICITGSIFVVADAREIWALYTGDVQPEADYPIEQVLLQPDAKAVTP